MQKSNKEDVVRKFIVRVIRRRHPGSVQELLLLVQSTFPKLSKEEILLHIENLQDEGRISFKKPLSHSFSAARFVFSSQSFGYWVILAFSIVFDFIVTFPSLDPTFINARNVLSLAFMLVVPGYSIIGLLFFKRKLRSIEKIALSLALSILVIVLIALLLNFSPWGIRPVPMATSLTVLVIFTSTIVFLRSYYAEKKEALRVDVG